MLMLISQTEGETGMSGGASLTKSGHIAGLDGLRALAIDEGIVLAADKFGKAKTVLQIFAIVPLTLHYPLWGMDLQPLGLGLLYTALVLAIVSGSNYCYDFYCNTRKQAG